MGNGNSSRRSVEPGTLPLLRNADGVRDARVDLQAMAYSYEAYLPADGHCEECDSTPGRCEACQQLRVPHAYARSGWRALPEHKVKLSDTAVLDTRFLVAVDGVASPASDVLFIAGRGTQPGSQANLVTDLAFAPMPLSFGWHARPRTRRASTSSSGPPSPW